MSRLVLGLLITTVLAAGCAAEPAENAGESGEAITAKADDHWFYAGPIPALKDASVTVSLQANTAHVIGFLPAGAAELPQLPHVKTKSDNGRTRVDIVYPIATA